MKLVILFLIFAIISTVFSAPAPQGDDKDAEIVKSESDIQSDGYSFSYETSNGIAADEQGKLENAGTDDEVMKVSGSFSYTGPDGVKYTVTYTADENGFVPVGDHIPKK